MKSQGNDQEKNQKNDNMLKKRKPQIDIESSFEDFESSEDQNPHGFID